MLHRFRAAIRAFAHPEPTTPELSTLAATTNNVLNLLKRRPPLTPHSREQIKRNPYIYAALRNTADEIISKWNGAESYVPHSAEDAGFQRPPQIFAASASPIHEQQAAHLRWNIDHRLQRGWATVIRQILTGREDGKSVQEIQWAWQPGGPYRGTWVMDDILSCDPDCFGFSYHRQTNPLSGAVTYQRVLRYNPNGAVSGSLYLGAASGKAMPENKFLVYAFDNFYEQNDGESILTKLDLFDWYQRNNFAFWMVALNRYGSPLVVGEVPRGASEAQRDAMLAAIDSIQQETGIVITEGEKVTMLQSMNQGATGFDLLDRLINRMISVVITGHALAMEEGLTGSYSYANATTVEIREILLHTLANAIDDVINRQLIPAFMKWNYPQETEYPHQELLPPRPKELAPGASPTKAGGTPPQAMQGNGIERPRPNPKEVMYYQYLTQNDDRVRPTHQQMHGVIRPVGDALWRIWWPPCGYNCRCYIRPITRAEAEAEGLAPTPALPPVYPDPGFYAAQTILENNISGDIVGKSLDNSGGAL